MSVNPDRRYERSTLDMKDCFIASLQSFVIDSAVCFLRIGNLPSVTLLNALTIALRYLLARSAL